MTIQFYKCLSCGVNFSAIILGKDGYHKCPYCSSKKIRKIPRKDIMERE